jgi:hypothetical protein
VRDIEKLEPEPQLGSDRLSSDTERHMDRYNGKDEERNKIEMVVLELSYCTVVGGWRDG